MLSRRWIYKATLIFGLLIANSSSQAGLYFTYFEWQQLPQSVKILYVSGAIDAYFTFSYGYQKYATHYESCVMQQHISNSQLTDGVEQYAKQHPASQTLGIPAIAVQYLHEVCGEPADK